MTFNFPSPYGLRYLYTVDGLTHKGEVLVNITEDVPVGTAFVDITVNTKSGGTDSLADFVTAYFPALRALYDTSTDIFAIELWKYEPDSFDATFISATTTTYVGSNAGANVLSGYQMFTFRSMNGGIMKIVCLEPCQNNEGKLGFPSLNTAEQAFANVITASTSPVIARDNGYLALFNFMSGGQNEKVWRIRNR